MNLDHVIVQNCDVKEMDQSSIYPDGTPSDKRKWNYSIAMDTTIPNDPNRTVSGSCVISRVYGSQEECEEAMTHHLRDLLV
jgi:hypothetical protein